MPQSPLDEILHRIRSLQSQLEREFDQLLKEKQAQFRYRLEKGKVIFDNGVRDIHQRYRTGIWAYLRAAKISSLLTAPIIYSVIVPLVLIDLSVTLYQLICFPVYGIAKVKRKDYLIFDRHHLDYLNLIEKANCLYCSYGNGMIAYVREIIARTEQYWCPIKHAHQTMTQHERMQDFADYGNAEEHIKKQQQLRKALKPTRTEAP